ncbi:MAG: SpoIID/LytB domain-containing protein [Acidobacteria bacterium]|nr:SpoIID/LytB domain-containing protein [Acidobacteriota bacterium]
MKKLSAISCQLSAFRILGVVLVLGLGSCATTPRPPVQVPQPTPTPVVTPTPTPQPTPTAVPTVPPPATVPTDDLEEPLIRVLLRRTSKTITLPQPGRAWRLTAATGAAWLWGPLTISRGLGQTWYQVGAFGGGEAALEADRALKRIFGDTVDVRSLPENGGLNRVQVHWISAQPVDSRTALDQAGFPGAFPVSTGGKARVEGQGGAFVSEGEILMEPAGDFPAVVGGRSYRGRFRVRPSGADEVLLINELNLERYLLGVVPAEMGPSVFPQVEALKAQAVAARTYAIAHLGDHDGEGYDICDTPACQVYPGAGVEHSLSTRAIEETTGLVAVFDGSPIDAMYTSTCGGHTETSSELFSGRAQPYLQAVPCAWDRDLQLIGDGSEGPWQSATDFGAVIAQHVLGLGSAASPEMIVQAIAGKSGTVVSDRTFADLEAFSRALLEAGRLTRSAEILSSEASALEGLLFLADLYKAPLDPPVDGLQSSWPAAAALAVLELRGIVVRDRGEAVPRPGGVGIFPRRAKASESLPATVPLWERWREGYRQRAVQTVRPGAELERLRIGDQVVGLIVRRSGGSGEADRRSAWREWVREKPWSELAQRLGIPDLEKLEITRRTDFGRVVGLAAVGRGGQRKEWTGFDVRRALDLPETLFTVNVVTRPDGVKVARFLGRGWGHGVGLCQNGAYGLARSGMTFDRILKHYYSGIQLVNWGQ